MHVTAIANYKGGCGKTTTAVNLAYELSGYCRVLLVDMDPQQDSSYILRSIPKQRCLDDALIGKTTLSYVCRKSRVSDQLYICTGSDSMEELELEADALRKSLQAVASGFDICIIDTHPGLNMLTINALVAADDIIIPVLPSRLSMNGLEKMGRYISQAREFNPDLKIQGALVTMFAGTKAQVQLICDMMQTAGVPVFDTCISYDRKADSACERRKPLHKHARSRQITQDYADLAEEYIQKRKEEEQWQV